MATGDWRPLRNGQRQYVNDDTGEVISRRHYLDIQAKATGWDSYREFQSRMTSKPYLQKLKFAAQHGKVDRESASRMDSEFNTLYAQAKAVGFDRTVAGRNPKGAMHKFLVYLGLRDETDYWDVGDTPFHANEAAA